MDALLFLENLYSAELIFNIFTLVLSGNSYDFLEISLLI
ncbi:hypothetical protein LMANV2_90092 [Leptospira interrogans serovar Manilae]|uniref:Uncharacterized protein n=1 Tax=Leptospira interrogans serovar Manilae TaxID=214675 RepID=A0AAQ1SQZ5_LEPIR|nr:hypothetical protein LMANV2_90092 [Leptospira interrogans serovar Manilae]